jgi:hypothetical protein
MVMRGVEGRDCKTALRLAPIAVVVVALTSCDEPPAAPVATPVAMAASRTAAPVAAAASRSAPSEADAGMAWETVPLSRLPPIPFGSVETWQTFVRALRTPESPLTVCSQGWKPPPGFATMDLEAELRVRAVGGFLVVEDLIILGGNIGDSEFEACLVREYRGRRAPAPTVEPGGAFRIAWPIRKWLE